MYEISLVFVDETVYHVASFANAVPNAAKTLTKNTNLYHEKLFNTNIDKLSIFLPITFVLIIYLK